MSLQVWARSAVSHGTHEALTNLTATAKGTRSVDPSNTIPRYLGGFGSQNPFPFAHGWEGFGLSLGGGLGWFCIFQGV